MRKTPGRGADSDHRKPSPLADTESPSPRGGYKTRPSPTKRNHHHGHHQNRLNHSSTTICNFAGGMVKGLERFSPAWLLPAPARSSVALASYNALQVLPTSPGARSVSDSDSARVKQSRAFSRRCSRDMGLAADPLNAEPSALAVLPSFSNAVASVAPDSGPSGSTPDAAQHILHVRRETAGVREGVDANVPVQQSGGGAVFHAELAVQPAARRRPRMAPSPAVNGHLLNVGGVDAVLLRAGSTPPSMTFCIYTWAGNRLMSKPGSTSRHDAPNPPVAISQSNSPPKIAAA